MNKINLSLQGKTVAVFDANAKVKCLLLRGNLYIGWNVWEKEYINCYPFTEKFFIENKIKLQEKM